jgi:ammonium transporter, Amt family
VPIVYGALKAMIGIWLSEGEEFEGSDLSIHRIGSSPERKIGW